MHDKQPTTSSARLLADLASDHDVDDVVRRISSQALVVIPSCTDSSVTLRVRRRRLSTQAATSQLAEQLDADQYELGQGPCVSAATVPAVISSGEVARDRRWPDWGPRAWTAGVASVLSLPLSAAGDHMGSLNLYSPQPRAFEGVVDHAVAYADSASVVLEAARRVSGLQRALDSRHTIGLAQGILMARFGLEVDASFDVLCRWSSHENVRLADLAAEIVRTRDVTRAGRLHEFPPADEETQEVS